MPRQSTCITTVVTSRLAGAPRASGTFALGVCAVSTQKGTSRQHNDIWNTWRTVCPKPGDHPGSTAAMDETLSKLLEAMVLLHVPGRWDGTHANSIGRGFGAWMGSKIRKHSWSACCLRWVLGVLKTFDDQTRGTGERATCGRWRGCLPRYLARRDSARLN